LLSERKTTTAGTTVEAFSLFRNSIAILKLVSRVSSPFPLTFPALRVSGVWCLPIKFACHHSNHFLTHSPLSSWAC